jgi:hypothetical protein
MPEPLLGAVVTESDFVWADWTVTHINHQLCVGDVIEVVLSPPREKPMLMEVVEVEGDKVRMRAKRGG